jgi:hypothetical protein
MRKYLIAATAAGWIGLAFAAGNTPDEQFQQYSAQGRAYMTYDFGGARRANDAALPLHYGFRVDSESRLAEERYTGLTDRRVPAVMQIDFAADGSRLASLNGVPFAGRSFMQRQNGDTSPDAGSAGAATTEPGGFTWFDWTLLAVGVGGVGYIIAEVSKGKDSPDPKPASTTTGGTLSGLLGGLLGGTTGGTTTGSTLSGLLGGLTGGYAGSGTGIEGERITPEYQNWLDGGSGQMGDLGG